MIYRNDDDDHNVNIVIIREIEIIKFNYYIRTAIIVYRSSDVMTSGISNTKTIIISQEILTVYIIIIEIEIEIQERFTSLDTFRNTNARKFKFEIFCLWTDKIFYDPTNCCRCRMTDGMQFNERKLEY